MNNSEKWIWKEEPRPDAEMKLFCFHHAGGSSIFFRGWKDFFPNIELNCIQLPGRWTRSSEPSLTSMSELVEAMYADLREQLNGQFAFMGYSLGGLVAFELCRKLQDENHQLPTHLFISSRAAPDNQTGQRTFDLPLSMFLTQLEEKYGALPSGLKDNAEIQEMLLPPLRSDLQLIETYVCRDLTQVRVPITAFAGQSDNEAQLEKLTGWQKFTSKNFNYRILKGGHFLPKEEMDKMATEINAILNRR